MVGSFLRVLVGWHHQSLLGSRGAGVVMESIRFLTPDGIVITSHSCSFPRFLHLALLSQKNFASGSHRNDGLELGRPTHPPLCFFELSSGHFSLSTGCFTCED